MMKVGVLSMPTSAAASAFALTMPLNSSSFFMQASKSSAAMPPSWPIWDSAVNGSDASAQFRWLRNSTSRKPK